MNEPRRGEVWMVDLGMTAKVRPCLVISIGATEQERALATLVPHTTSIRNSRFEVNLKVRFLREGVFDAQRHHPTHHGRDHMRGRWRHHVRLRVDDDTGRGRA